MPSYDAISRLSFAKKAEKGVFAADIDIDLLIDMGHFGEVIRNKITKMKPDPFTVYTLLFDQGIRPLYTLKISKTKSNGGGCFATHLRSSKRQETAESSAALVLIRAALLGPPSTNH